jgi:hypothetical protein
VLEEVVAHLKLNFARDADDNFTVEIKEEAFGAPDAENQSGVSEDLLAVDPVFEVIECSADEQGNEDGDAVLHEHANAAQGVSPAVFLEVGEKRLQSLKHAGL